MRNDRSGGAHQLAKVTKEDGWWRVETERGQDETRSQAKHCTAPQLLTHSLPSSLSHTPHSSLRRRVKRHHSLCATHQLLCFYFLAPSLDRSQGRKCPSVLSTVVSCHACLLLSQLHLASPPSPPPSPLSTLVPLSSLAASPPPPTPPPSTPIKAEASTPLPISPYRVSRSLS